jgi:hypothetical protein
MRRPTGPWFRAMFITACILNGFVANCLAQPQSVTLAGEWRTVSLPFRAINLTSVANTYWVCGADEMIAKSEDAGRTWIVKHQRADGEVLLHVAFLREDMGYAAGTNGMILWTKDGGETWTGLHSDSGTILDISFSDDRNGLRRVGSSVEVTHDGGATWSRVSAYQSNKELEEFKAVAAVAALDDKSAAILFREGPERDDAFVTTSNGGKTWNTISIPNARVWSLIVHNGEYWAFGFEVIEKDKPGGGYGVALALHSPDGVKWLHGVRAPSEFSDCNAQGCILWDGATVELYHDKPMFTATPADGSLTPVWASTNATVCSVGALLKCADARSPLDQPPLKPQFNRPSTGSIDPLLRKTTSPVRGCLICHLEPFPLSKKLLGQIPVSVNRPREQLREMYLPGIKSTIEVEFLVRKDGTTSQVHAKHAPNKQIESAVTQNIESWVIDPSGPNGAHVEEKQKAKIEVSCMAFPSNEEALCTLQAK